jgi:hypothetical protein
MTLVEEIIWLKAYLVELVNYLRNPDDLTGRLSFEQAYMICREISIIDARIGYLTTFPEWALKYDFEESELVETNKEEKKWSASQ